MLGTPCPPLGVVTCSLTPPEAGTLPASAPFPGTPPTPMSECQFPILSRRPGISSFHPWEDGLKLHSSCRSCVCTRTHARTHAHTHPRTHTHTPSHTSSRPTGKSTVLSSATLTFNTGSAPLLPGAWTNAPTPREPHSAAVKGPQARTPLAWLS